MRISTALSQLKTDYPPLSKFPINLLGTPEEKLFKPNSRKIPFREQYANESRPHIIRHIEYQFGKIKRRQATLYFHNGKPIRLVYSGVKDKLGTKMMKEFPPRVKFPPNTVSSPIARNLREIGLKWVVEQFFMSQDYLMFDEPTLEQVTPDCLVVPAIKGNKILEIAGKETKHPNNLTELDIKDALFVEIKAYHKTTKVGEKEILQTYNYGIKGGKAILITTGELDRFDKLDMLKDIELEPVKDGEEMVFQEAAYQEFIRQVKSKNKGHIKALDMSISQDSYDTRGIYYSAHKKLQKIHKYTKDWPEGFQYSLLDSPQKILDFLTSEETLGIVKSGAFLKLLQQKGLDKAADLFFQIQERYLEEIIVNPSFLYPTIPHK